MRVPLPALSPFLVGALVGVGLLTGCNGPEIPLADPPQFSNEAPVQTALSSAPPIRAAEDVFLARRAAYQLDALVMSRKGYDGLITGDELGHVVPVDLALAWGRAARPDAQSVLTIRQSGRWFHWRYPGGVSLPVPTSELVRTMANVHIIPADVFQADAIARVEAGRCYRFGGTLVDIESKNPRLVRRTSLTRADSGAGACEIFRVERVEELACPTKLAADPD